MLSAAVSLDTSGALQVDDLDWLQSHVNIGRLGEGGHLYAKYSPGNIVGAALIYRLMALPGDLPYVWGNAQFGYHELAPSATGVHFALRLDAVIGALGMAALFALAWQLYGRTAAVTSVLVVGLGTDWWYQSRGFFSEVGAGAGLIGALYFAERRRPYASSVILGLSLLFRPTNLLALPAWFYSMRRSGWREAPSIAFILASISGLAYYNVMRFGSLIDFGYGTEGFTGNVPVGLFGVLLSPGRSLFLYSPILIMAIVGAAPLLARKRMLAWLVFGISAAYVLAVAGWDVWWGGKVWGSRLLTPIIPVLGIPIASMMDRALQIRPPRLVWTMAILAILGVGIELLTLTQNPVTVLDSYLSSGYASYADSIMSPTKNALALQVRNAPNTGPCTADAFSIRALFPECK